MIAHFLGIYETVSGPLLLDATPRIARAPVVSTNERGFEQLSCDLRLTLADAYRLYEYGALPWVRYRISGYTIFEGRLSDPELIREAVSGVTLTAFGAWDALSDIPYTALWSDSSFERWDTVQPTETGMSSAIPARYQFAKASILEIAPQKNAVYSGASSQGRFRYRTPDRGGRQIVNVSFDTVRFLSTNWLIEVYRYDRDGTYLSTVLTLAGTGAVLTRSCCITMSGCDTLILSLYPTSTYTYTGETGAEYMRLSNARITTQPLLVDTTLTNGPYFPGATSITVASAANITVGLTLFIVTTTDQAGDRVTVTSVSGLTIGITALVNASYGTGDHVRAQRVLASDIASDLAVTVNAANPTQLAASSALINPDAVTLPDLPDVIYEDASMPRVLSDLAVLGDAAYNRLECGIWEDQRLSLWRRGARSRAWFVDVTELRLRRSLESVTNSIYVTYQDADGRTRRTETLAHAQSVARFGVTRRAAVSAETASQSETTSLVEAERVRALALADRASPQPQALFILRDLLDGSGARWPAWMLRANDTVTVRALPSAFGPSVDRIRTFRVTRTEYDAQTGEITWEPEEPLPSLEMLLARVAADIDVALLRLKVGTR